MIGRRIVYHSQEADPLLMPVTLLAQTDYFAVQRVESREQRSGAIAFLIVRHGSGPAALQRQSRLRAVQGLNLTLLVATQPQGMLGWIEI
jgi:hypothetical protein